MINLLASILDGVAETRNGCEEFSVEGCAGCAGTCSLQCDAICANHCRNETFDSGSVGQTCNQHCTGGCLDFCTGSCVSLASIIAVK